MRNKLSTNHLERRACVYVRQSTSMQVHEHGESTRRQYALAERAVALGWARADVEIIDEDQGKSGASSEERSGFQRLADDVAHGELGAILAVEVSRLARSSPDWQRLLSLCAVTGVVVIDEQGIYDPGDRDDRLLLDLKGTMSEAELHWLRLRLVGGRVNKARRGELAFTPPVGYVWRDGRFALDPDEAVQTAVRLILERFQIEPTVWAVVRWAHQQRLKLPRRVGPHDGTGEVQWGPLTMGRLASMLHNPVYAGIYAYGRREQRKVIVDGEIRRRTKRLADDEWIVRITGAHPACIDVETYMSNRERLRQNQSRMHGAIGGTSPKDGRALLTGLVLCGRCGKRMRVDYSTHERTTWRYVCTGKNATEQNICWSIEGSHLDEHVEQLFLSTMVPEEIDLTIAVEKEASGQAHTLETQWKARLEQAHYEARRTERRYKAVDPDNRVVARTLEREWEARLQDLAEVEREYADARRTRHVDLTAADRAALRDIARDLPAVWNAPTTSTVDRKAMLRLVIEIVSLEPIDIPVRSARVRVQWKSGALDDRVIERPPWTRTKRPLPRVILDAIQAMLNDGLTNEQIAKRLNADGRRRRQGKHWTAPAVSHVRANYKLHRSKKLQYRFLPERHPVSGRYSFPGAARRFGVSLDVVRSWVHRGFVEVHRERFGRYDARWLDLDDRLGSQLANSSKQKS